MCGLYFHSVLISHLSFFFNDTATTEIYTLSLHDALPILKRRRQDSPQHVECRLDARRAEDRKSTRLNSSHSQISYAVFCLQKKKNNIHDVPGNSGTRHVVCKQPDKSGA